MFRRASSRVSPWEWQPGRSRKLTDQPASVSSRRILYYKGISAVFATVTKSALLQARLRLCPSELSAARGSSGCSWAGIPFRKTFCSARSLRSSLFQKTTRLKIYQKQYST
jgi:hypothetical protein